MQQQNRTPSIDKERLQKGLKEIGRKLGQSPSLVNIQGNHINSDDGGEDELQPMKPIISYDPNQEVDPNEMPMLASKHRQVGGKKGSVNIGLDKNQRLLNENES